MIRSFDNIAIGTKLVKDSDPDTTYSVSDFGLEYENGRMVTTLILVKLNADGHRAARIDSNGHKIASRRVTVKGTPANRAAWSKK